MGRKIPGKKHHGVKDPAVQKFKRELILKDKINAPPTKADYQETPKSVIEIGRLKELAKNSKGSFKPKKKKRKGKKGQALLDLGKLGGAGPKLPGMKQHDKNLPRLQQQPGESEGKFLHRVESATSDLISEVQMEAHHNIVIRRDKSGEVVKVEKGKKKLDEVTKHKIRKSVQDFHSGKSVQPERTTRKERREMKRITTIKYRKDTSQGGSQKKRLGKKQRMKLKQAPKKIEKELDGLEKRYEQVEFGEVVHEPPHIKKRPRGVDAASKPSVDGLLLTKMLNPKHTTKDVVSMAAKKRLEQQRLDVVQAYRDLKAARRNNPS